MDSIGVYLNWFPAFLSANVYLKGPIDVYLDRTQIFIFCQCLSDGFDLCLPELVPNVSVCQCLSEGTY